MKDKLWFDVVKAAEDISVIAGNIVDDIEETSADWELDDTSLVELAEKTVTKLEGFHEKVKECIDDNG